VVRFAGIVVPALAVSVAVLLAPQSAVTGLTCSTHPITYVATDPPFLAVGPQHGIAAVPARGGPPHWLLRYPAYQPSWSRDGTTFVFARGEYHTVIWASRGAGTPSLVTAGFSPAVSPDGRRVVFETLGDRLDLVLVNLDGTGRRLLVRGGWDAGWSPDGRRIVFVSRKTDDANLYAIDADGKNLRKLTRRGGISFESPVWSPDGRRIAFVGDGALRVIDTQKGTRGRLTHDRTSEWSGVESSVAWSPDGRQLAFTKGAGTGIFLISANGTHERRLTNTTNEEQDLAWAPNGRDIAYTSDPHTGIYSVDATGSQRQALTHDATSHDQLTRSQSSSRLAFARRRPTGTELVVTDACGRGSRILARLPYLAEPSWNPDATELAVVTRQGISRVGIDGRVRVLRRESYVPLALAWSPDGRSIAVVEGDGLYLVDVRSRRKHLVFSPAVPDEAENAAVTWAPDSSAVAFSFERARDPGFVGLHVVSTSGHVLAHVAGASDPAWSPDGGRIAYIGRDARVWTMDRSGRDESRVESRAFATNPRWSRDSSSIAFIGRTSHVNGVWVVDADGGAPRRIARGEVSELEW
jgi:Tol biopolymer transport system component